MTKPTAASQHADHAAQLEWFGWTDIGRVRKNNEDAFLGLRFDAQDVHVLGKHGESSLANHDFTFAVCDGMGGAKAGEYASQIAVSKITTLLPVPFKTPCVDWMPISPMCWRSFTPRCIARWSIWAGHTRSVMACKQP